MSNNEANFSEKKSVPVGQAIDVPFAEKDEAKALGARWNPEIKKWIIPEGAEKEKFKKWIK